MADGAECASDLGGGGEFNETFSFRGMDLSIKQDTVAGHAHVLWDASRVLGACCKPCVPAPLDLPLHLDPKFDTANSLSTRDILRPFGKVASQLLLKCCTFVQKKYCCFCRKKISPETIITD